LSAEEEREFQELIAALHTRETSTATVATVASSASLIMLGAPQALYGSSGIPNGLVIFAGIMFPILGEAYRELTIFGIDRQNVRSVRTLVGKDRYDALYETKGLPLQVARNFRRFIVRVFLFTPSFIWWAVDVQSYVPLPLNAHPVVTGALLFGVPSALLVWAEHHAKARDRESRASPAPKAAATASNAPQTSARVLAAPSSDYSRKKQKFLETLLTLGSLLAVFLGFVIDRFLFYLPYLVAFGVLFIVTALVSYTALIFRDDIARPFVRRWVPFVNGMLGMSFGGLITIGTSLVLSQIPGEYPTPLVFVGAASVIIVSMAGPIWLIRWVMRLGDTPPSRRSADSHPDRGQPP
jgi:hypothetical protein